jgi:hypothetical protein
VPYSIIVEVLVSPTPRNNYEQNVIRNLNLLKPSGSNFMFLCLVV